MSPYNDRHESLEKAKVLWNRLEAADEALMIERCISLGSFDMKERKVKNYKEWDSLYKEITALASQLHQGKLLTVLTYNAEDKEFSSVSFFGEMWKRGIESLETINSLIKVVNKIFDKNRE